MTSYRFFRRTMPDGGKALLGTATKRSDGWRFVPNTSGRKPSRKAHPTMEKCLPKWVGYPDRCESEAVS